MARLRLAIKKDKALRFLSHLDFARAVRYVVIRADLPVQYSEGFNPHMKIAFASALGVGVAAAEEYMDMELAETVDVEDVKRRMNEKAPEGFAVLEGHYVSDKAPKLMAIANYAEYLLSGPLTESIEEDVINRRLDVFNKAEEAVYEKYSPKTRKTRYINVKDHVLEPITAQIDGSDIHLRVRIYQNESGAVKPSQVWELLARQFDIPVDPTLMLAERTGLWSRQKGENRTLFEMP